MPTSENRLPQKFALIVAGGSGQRMGSTIAKQFMLLNGLPVLMHTLQRFADAEPTAELIVVLPASQLDFWRQLCSRHHFRLRHTLVSGGNTRFASVRNGLNAISERDGLVAVHDGVRPLVSEEIIRDSFAVANQAGSAVAVVPVKDSVREMLWGTERANRAIDRTRLRLVQTPQTFNLALLRDAFAQVQADDFSDDASVAEAAGNRITLIQGSYRNIKITTPEDLVLAEALLQKVED